MNANRTRRMDMAKNNGKQLQTLATDVSRRPALWLPGTIGGVTLALIWGLVGGLASCDSTAKFSLPDRKFNDVQVVTAFPSFIDDAGTITRICGAPLTDASGTPEVAQDANGLEFVINFVSTELKNPACAVDLDQSIKAHDLIELYPVQTGGLDPTVGPKNFEVDVQCIDGYGPASGCLTGVGKSIGLPKSVFYKQDAPRCDPNAEESRINVAILLDQSGSLSGLVDKNTFKEDTPNQFETPNTLEKSDPNGARIDAVNFLIDALNPDRDRVMGYYYNEKQTVQVAASDALYCFGGGDDGKKCVVNADCSKNGCYPDESNKDDSFDVLPFGEAEKAAFGSLARHRAYLKTGIDNKAKLGGEGRTPLYEALTTAYNFLKTKVTQNRHIVVVGDGPDTCTESEQYTYKNTAGKCRLPCNVFENFKKLRQQMHEDGYPVTLHFVQFQAKGYKQPDAHMMELACRTGGTYQFINTEEMNKSNGQATSNAMNRALIRVRNALSGSWRVGLRLQAMTDNSQIPTGKVMAVTGHIKFANPKFPSLSTVYQTQTSWKFDAASGFNEDRRLLFRKPCGRHTQCTGGADGFGDPECAANHCTEDGLCNSQPAPDRLPCGPINVSTGKGAQKCCGGKCAADCDGSCTK